MTQSASKMPAVFLDRDGTIIEDVDFLTSADQIRILPNTASGLISLRASGFRLVVVTNQSAIARGMMDEGRLKEIHQTLSHHLEMLGAGVDAFYWCPHLPDAAAARPEYAVDCDCRKPKPGLILRAAEELNIDLSASWMVGDGWRDVAAGQAAGLRTIKLPAPRGREERRPPDVQPPTAEAENFNRAAGIILSSPRKEEEAAPAEEKEQIEEQIPQAPVEVTTEAPPEAEAPPEEAEAHQEAEEIPSEEMPPEEAPPEEAEALQEAEVAEEIPSEEAQVEHVPPAAEPEYRPADEVPMASLAGEEEPRGDVESVAEVPVQVEPVPLAQPEAEPVSVAEGEPTVAEVPEEVPVEEAICCARCGTPVPDEDRQSGGGAGHWHGELVCAACLAKVRAISGGEGAEEEAGPRRDEGAILHQVLSEVRRLARRRGEEQAFPLIRLLAYVVQVAALFVGLVLVIVVDEKALFIQMAILLQILALTLFLIEKRR